MVRRTNTWMDEVVDGLMLIINVINERENDEVPINR